MELNTLMFIGNEGSQTAIFSRALAKDHLKVGVQVLSEDTFEGALPKMDKKTPIMIENGATVGKHQDLLLQTIKERDMTIIMMDCNEGDLHDYGVAVSPRGKHVAVKNNSNGRRQEVLVLSEEKVSAEYGLISVERPIVCTDQQPLEQEPTVSQSRISLAQPSATTPPVDAKTALMQSLVEFLKDESKPSTVASSSSHYWQHSIRISFQSYSDFSPRHPSAPDWLNKRLKTGFIKAFVTVDVNLYATKSPFQKWIQFKLTDAVGMTSKMGSDDNWARGFFNRSSHIYLYPGNGRDPQHTSLPAGWSRPNLEPHTPNSSTTYTSTTGWSFGVEGGGSPDGPSANVTASLSQSNQQTTTISDFSVRNISDGSMSGWNFYYTAVDGDKWKDHFTFTNAPKPIANLAKSTLHMNAEAVYRGPADTKEKITFTVKPEFQYGVLRGNCAAIFIYWIDRYLGRIHTSIDMSKVKNPKRKFF